MTSSLSGYRGPSGGMAGQNASGMKQVKSFDPHINQLYQQMFSQLGPESYTSRLAGGDQSMFEEMEAPAMRQFQQLQGQNASRFSGMGMGSRHGSGFQNFQNQASSDFAQDLASKRQGLQQQAIKDLMSMSNDLLGNAQSEPEEQSFWQKLLGGVDWSALGGAAGSAIGSAVPGIGTAIGGLAGASLGALGNGLAGSGRSNAMSGAAGRLQGGGGGNQLLQRGSQNNWWDPSISSLQAPSMTQLNTRMS